jgi:hypothetical protein
MGLAIEIGAATLLAALVFPPGGRAVFKPSDYGFTGPAGCVLPSTPPYITGMAIPAASPEDAEAAAARLGFAGYWEGDLFVCPISEQAMVWVVGGRLPPDTRIAPLVPQVLAHRTYEPPDRALPLGLWPIRRPMKAVQAAPNGAIGIWSVIAIIPSADSVAKVWPPPRSNGDKVPLLSFSSPVALEPFSAWSRVAGAGSGSVTLLEPASDDGLAARWLAGGARWIGIEVIVASVEKSRVVRRARGRASPGRQSGLGERRSERRLRHCVPAGVFLTITHSPRTRRPDHRHQSSRVT